jgi:glycosyltransferase involved in cell wall biosynthesis
MTAAPSNTPAAATGPRKQTPRVLVLSHLFPAPDNAALGCFVHEQVRALREGEGIDARVVCGRPLPLNRSHPVRLWRNYRAYRGRFTCLGWEVYQGVPLLNVPYLVEGVLRPFWLHGASYRGAVRRAVPFLRATFPFDLVHAHTAYLDGGAARALGRRLGVPYVVTEHTNPFHRLTDNPVVRGQALRALGGAVAVWCVSAALTAEVRRHLPEAWRARVRTLANGVDLSAFRPPPHWEPDPSAPRLVSVTALEPYKNPLLLLRAFRRLHAAVPGASLTVVGAGPLEPEARAYLAAHGLGGRVALPGRLPRPEVARLLREACDLFVLSSDSETFGVALVEALACGKPAVATDCGGPRDVLTGPGLGLLCPPGDEAALAGALLRAVRGLGAFDPAAIRRHAERFRLTALAARLAGEYRGLLGRAGRVAA